MELRPYQQEAREAIFEQWDSGVKKTLLVLPTGCGKTIVFAKVTEDCVRRGDRVLILAHRGELLKQASDKIRKSTGLGCAMEKAEETCKDSWFRIAVGSVQTMMREKRLSQFAEDYFNTIIIDEAHHCISDSYQRVLQHFPDAHVLGVTATPDRGDMRNLGSYFETLAYEYTLPKAIKEGYLTPIKALTIPLKIDMSGVTVQAGDFISIVENPRLAMYNLYSAAKALADFQKEYDLLFSDYSSLNEDFAKQELENVLTLVNVWRYVLDNQPKGYAIAYDAKQKYCKGTKYFYDTLSKAVMAVGGTLLKGNKYAYTVSVMIEDADEQSSKQLNFVQHFFDCYEKIEAVISSKNDSTELIQVIEMVYIVMFALLPFVSKYDLQHKNI